MEKIDYGLEMEMSRVRDKTEHKVLSDIRRYNLNATSQNTLQEDLRSKPTRYTEPVEIPNILHRDPKSGEGTITSHRNNPIPAPSMLVDKNERFKNHERTKSTERNKDIQFELMTKARR